MQQKHLTFLLADFCKYMYDLSSLNFVGWDWAEEYL